MNADHDSVASSTCDSIEQMDMDEEEHSQINSCPNNEHLETQSDYVWVLYQRESAIAEHRKRQLCLANENVLAKSAEVERLTKEFDEARNEVDHLQKTLKPLVDSFGKIDIGINVELEQARLENQTLRVTNDKLQSQLNGLYDDIRAQSADRDNLIQELEGARKKTEQDLAVSQIKVQKLTEKIEQLNIELVKYQEINTTLKSKTDIYCKDINAMEEKLKNSERQTQLSTQNLKDAIKNYSDAVKERDTTIKTLDACNAGLQNELTRMNNKVADLETNQECLQREIGVNKSKLEMYTNEIHSLTETITHIQAENIPLSRSVTTLHVDVARLNKEKAQIRGKYEEFQNSLKLKENELAKEKSKHNKNQPDKDSYQKQFLVERTKWNSEKTKLEITCNFWKGETNRITQEHTKVKEALKKTEEERDELTLRLSKLASASLTHNNPNIADLSDPNRPTKLTEAFSELYDNEWTDAFENLKEDDERITVDRLLMMLQKAYGFSVTLTDEASKHMGVNVTSLTLNYNRGSNVQPMHKSTSRHAEKRNVDTTEHRDSSETRLEDKSKANSCTEFTEHITSNCDAFGEKYKSIYFKVDSLELKTIFKEDTQHNELTANHGFAGVKSKTDVSNPDAICGQEHQMHAKDTISLYKDTAVQVGSQEEMNVATVSFDFDILSPTEKQTINGIRKRILHALKDQIIPMIAEAVVGEMNLQACADSIITYVKACASICWEMRIHQPPVFLEFLEIDDQTPFNTAIYKHYTKQGLRMDYVVWPAMYLYKGGALLSKGVAQGH